MGKEQLDFVDVPCETLYIHVVDTGTYVVYNCTLLARWLHRLHFSII